MKDIALAITYNFQLKLVSHTSHSQLFLALYEDIKIVINDLKTKLPIFIVKTEDYDFILG